MIFLIASVGAYSGLTSNLDEAKMVELHLKYASLLDILELKNHKSIIEKKGEKNKVKHTFILS